MPDYDKFLSDEPSSRRRKYRVYARRFSDDLTKRWTTLLAVLPLDPEIDESESPVVSPLAGPGPGGHKPSFRSTKLARRARSFKDDFLEKISQMRSPTNQGLRCSSPKNRTSKPNVIDTTTIKKGPIHELDLLEKQIQIALTHFRDVVSKNTLEMLPGNGTIVLDTVWAINLGVKSCTSESSTTVLSATRKMYQSVAQLIKLCDDVLIDGDQSAALDEKNVKDVLAQVENSVKHLITLVQEKIALQQSISYKSHGNASLDMPAQRNSLPDIPLTPRDRQILEQTSCVSGKVRGSHSSESVLRDPSPPPKPPIPDGIFFSISRTEVDDADTPPPLPPKKKVNRSYQPVDECFSSNNSLFNSSLERMSPEDSSSPLSASIGSLDSNRSKEEREIKAIMDNTDSDTTMMDSDLSNITGLDDSFLKQNSSSFFNQSNELHVNNFFANRLSNTDSGFVSVDSHRSSSYSKRSSQQSSVSSHWNSSAAFQAKSATISTAETKTESSKQTSYSQRTVNTVSLAGTKTTLTVENPADIPPAIPEKQKKRQPQNRQPSPYDNVPDNNLGGEVVIACEMHQSQSLCSSSSIVSSNNSIEDSGEPPPLPPKKRHMFQSVAYSVMAYMEMIGNCSHAHEQEAMRHSVHMVQGQWTNPSTGGLSSTQSCTFSQSSFSSSEFSNKQTMTLQPLNNINSNNSKIPALNSTLSNGVPPALPPKRTRTKFNSASETPTSPTVILPEENKSLPNLLEHTPLTTPAAVTNGGSNLQPTLTESKNSKPTTNVEEEEEDLMEALDVSKYLILKKQEEDGPDIRGGRIEALIIMATKATKNGVFTYQEAFLTTYRTFITPYDLITKLILRYNHFYCIPDRKPRSREAFALIVRVVSDLTPNDLNKSLQQKLMDFVQDLINCGELTLAKALRVKHLEKYEAKMRLASVINYPLSLTLCSRSYTLNNFKAEHIAEQMTLLDAELFMKIEIPEVLIWAQEQNEERSPNLTRFTEHFNKMSYWARTKILSADSKDREKYFTKFIKIMKHLRKINNYNSYLAILSALDSAPVRRLEWQKHIQEGLKEYCALIDSSSSFRAYRQALAETQPPCIPYIGLVLQDLTFVHTGNCDLLPDGSINFSKRWQQFGIVENMKRFKKCTYNFNKNERIINFFHNFDDFIGEDAMWQLSEMIKPRKGKKIP